MTLLGGPPLLVVGVAFLTLAFLAARSLAFLSGAFLGAAATLVILIVRAQFAACDAFEVDPIQGCQGFGVPQFLAATAVLIGIGLVLAVIAWRRGGLARRATMADADPARTD